MYKTRCKATAYEHLCIALSFFCSLVIEGPIIGPDKEYIL